jgi:hypothetical protein
MFQGSGKDSFVSGKKFPYLLLYLRCGILTEFHIPLILVDWISSPCMWTRSTLQCRRFK